MRDHDPMRFDPGPEHFILLEDAGRIVPDLPDITGLQSPARTGSNRGGHLASGKNFRHAKFDLRIEGREMRKTDKRVGSVQPHANDIDDGRSLWHTDTLRKSEFGARGNEQKVRLIIFPQAGR